MKTTAQICETCREILNQKDVVKGPFLEVLKRLEEHGVEFPPKLDIATVISRISEIDDGYYDRPFSDPASAKLLLDMLRGLSVMLTLTIIQEES
jgi:hypothetical protein